MKKYLIILLVLGLFISCSPQKRIQRLVDKHGEIVPDTLRVDTGFVIPELNFDTAIEKEIIIDSNKFYVDTTSLVLEDGTEIIIIDSSRFVRDGDLKKIKKKTNIEVKRAKNIIPIKLDIPYSKIEIKPPDKLDMLLQNIKWIVLFIFGIGFIIYIIKK